MWPAYLATLLFAISAVSAHRTTQALGGIPANFWRITLATIFLGCWAHTVGGGISGPAFPIFLLSGCVGFGIGDAALYQALPRIGSRLSVLLVHCVAAPFAAVTEWLWLGTSLTGAQILSSLTILAGVALALAPGDHLQISRRVLAVGTFYGVLAALGQGMGAVLSRKAILASELAGQPVDGMTAAYQRILAGWVVAALLLMFRRSEPGRSQPRTEAEPAPAPKPRRIWPWVFLNALAGPCLGVGFYQWALLRNPTGTVLPVVATTPLVVIPFARFIEGEKPSGRSIVGGLIAVAGAIQLARLR